MNMPLNRDQQYPKKPLSLGDSSLTDDRFFDISKHNTGFTSHVQSTSQNESIGKTWRKQVEDIQPTLNLQNHKLPLPTINLEKSKQNRSLPSTAGPTLVPRQAATAAVPNEWKPKISSHTPVNAFDDTESFNQSELDRDDNEEVTAVLRLDHGVDVPQQGLSKIDQNIPSYTVRETSKIGAQNIVSSHKLQDDLRTLQYKNEFKNKAQDPIPDVLLSTKPFVILEDDDFDMQMDTPSRPQITTQPGIIPGLKKKVGFVSDAEVFGSSLSSPFVQSAELARESSPELQAARASPTRPPRDAMSHENHEQKEMILRDRPKNEPPMFGPTSTRFTKMQEHKSRVVQQSNKVSAPDSDAQESSDDEQAHAWSRGREEVENPVSLTRKRPYDCSTESEYSLEEIKHKKLSDFQEEPFLRSPKTKNKHLDDSNQHERLLALRLLKLQEYTQDEQRKIFRAQNDEDWIETGQWFVDRFQEDLKKLMAIRLERRKTALKYEDKLRRRQKEVELAQSGVEKELRELESGGGELIRNRKAPSRASTPMKLQ